MHRSGCPRSVADPAPELSDATALAARLWPAIGPLSETLEGSAALLDRAAPLWEGTDADVRAEMDGPRDLALALVCGLAATRAAAGLADAQAFDRATALAHVPLPDTPLGQVLTGALTEGVLDGPLGGVGPSGPLPLLAADVGVDACAHLYDALLKLDDGALSRRRGVYYTPRAVAHYIVERTDTLMVERGGVGGLGSLSPERCLIDPATGTGIFLCEVVEHVWRRSTARDVDFTETVRPVLSSLRGHELLPVPRALCHLQLALTLLRRGGCAADALRVSLSAESFLAAAARHAPTDVAVVIGNPPYRRGAEPPDAGVRALLQDYRHGLQDERNLQPLADDYIRFIRVAQHLLSGAPGGVLAMVTNHGLLRGRLHRAMRASLHASFPLIEVLDLHGSVRVRAADAARDGNVFGIGQGVCVLHMVGAAAEEPARGGAGVRHAELRGAREEKLARLAEGRLPRPVEVVCTPPYHPFCPERPVPEEYARFHALPSLFDFHSVAAKPGHDRLLVGYETDAVLAGLAQHRGAIERGEVAPTTEASRRLARRPHDAPFEPARVAPYAYRPFDMRLAYHDDSIWTRPLRRLHAAMAGQPALLTTRIVKDSAFAHVFAAAVLPDVISLSSTSSVNAYAFPRASLSADALAAELPESLSADALFAFIYAVLHSPAYRERYLPAMRNDFPRIPAVRSAELAAELVEAGKRLLALHLGTASPVNGDAVRFHDGGDRTLRRVGEPRKTLVELPGEGGRLHINDDSYFEPVPLAVWNARVGAYRVAHKWLDDRRRAGRTLDDDTVARYRRVLSALAETLALQGVIDAALAQHGGVPGAFR